MRKMNNRSVNFNEDILVLMKLVGIVIVSILVTAATISNTTAWWLEFLFEADAAIPVLAEITGPIAAAVTFFSIFGFLVAVWALVAFVKNKNRTKNQ